MTKKTKKSSAKKAGTLQQALPVYERIREILESAHVRVARSVNTTQVVANWLIGREIVEEEQRGRKRAEYGEELLKDLSRQLTNDYGRGYSVSVLQYMRAFFQVYPELLPKQHAARVILAEPEERTASASRKVGSDLEIGHSLRDQSWQPGQLHPNLSWTHYRTLLRVEKPEARSFYEIEAVQNNWSAANWNARSTACFTNGWPRAETKRG